ncbi:MAG: phosphatidylglycerophosphatase A [Methanolobus sp. T82-4]|jgi:phosphatidylglycerophosphatase A|nr:MAG: phosphatidylglycerophosphatase A [Methanolobus sp. T82-4]
MSDMSIFIASLAGIGWLPFAAGIASVLGAGWGWWLRSHSKYWHYILILQVFLAIAISENAVAISGGDPPYIIIDEFVAAAFLIIPAVSMIDVVTGFILFSLLDYYEIFGIHRVESLHGGFGIVLDDMAAVLLSILFVILINRTFRYWKRIKNRRMD